jgi:nucleotide-binding universal stress UspA family protein
MSEGARAMKEKSLKVLWAVDPFSEDKAFQLKVAKALMAFTKGTALAIEPVSVLSPDQMRVPKAIFTDGKKDYRLHAEKTLVSWCKQLKGAKFLAPTLLVQESFSVSESAKTLIQYAKQTGAQLMGVGTHTRKPLHRFLFGSFAETLSLLSDVPTLIVPPRAESNLKVDRVLFPTDFTDKSQKAFRQILDLAKESKLKVAIFHKVQFELPPPLFGFEPVAIYKDFLAEDIAKKRELAEKWYQLAKQTGVTVEIVMDEKPGDPVPAILKAAKKQRCSVVALASESGSFSGFVLGSISRQLLRRSTIPVWVVHPH